MYTWRGTRHACREHLVTRLPLDLPAQSLQTWVEDQTGNGDAQQLMFWLYAEAAGGYDPSSISVFEMARLLATELKGDSENQLFYGAAAQFVGKLAEVRRSTEWAGQEGALAG